MNRPWKRLAFGLALLALMVAMTVMATSSALAFTIGTDQPSAANNNSPSNAPGALSALSIRPASSEMFTANYYYNNNILTGTPAAMPASSSAIRTMYQQWRHDQQNDWFYLFAQRAAGQTATSAITWNFYYYVAGRGVATLAAGVADGASIGATALTVSTIYLDSGTGTRNPAFLVETVGANSNGTVGGAVAACTLPTAVVAGTPGPCTSQFQSSLRWGLAQQGFRSGSMTLLQAVETFSITTPSVGAGTVYYDSWEPPVAAGANVVTLSDRAPTQAATDVTNATGTRQSNLGVPYSMTQSVGDADGDLSGQSLVWVFSGGSQAGQWFQAGIYNNRADQGASSGTNTAFPGTGGPGTASAFYTDWRTAPTSFSVGSPTTVGYFTQLTISAPTQITTSLNSTSPGAASTGVTSQSATYTFIYSASAIGSVNIYGRAEDWHGLSSGNVLVGTQQIT